MDFCKHADPHTLHKTGFSPCAHAFGCTVEGYVNMPIHTLDKKMISIQCVCMLLSKREFYEKDDPQTLQEHGFSWVCIRMCFFKSQFCENTDSHISEENNFSTVFTCVFLK